MDTKGQRVVVFIEEQIYIHKASGLFAAHYDALDLTAYGETEHEAQNNLKRLFNNDIHYYREKGLLERRLDALGVKWERENECTVEYEDTDELVNISSGKPTDEGFIPLSQLIHEVGSEGMALPLAA